MLCFEEESIDFKLIVLMTLSLSGLLVYRNYWRSLCILHQIRNTGIYLPDRLGHEFPPIRGMLVRKSMLMAQSDGRQGITSPTLLFIPGLTRLWVLYRLRLKFAKS